MPTLDIPFTVATVSDPAPCGKATPDSMDGIPFCLAGGNREAFDHLVPLVYRELRSIAARHLRREAQNHTLQPTALIHEAYLKLANYDNAGYRNRTHFLAVAARVMRQILVDHAKARHAAKRGPAVKITLHENVDFAPERDRVVMALDDALSALAKVNELRARVVELRFFAGMTAENIAECIAMPVRRVRRELLIAQAWLRREIEA